MTALVHEENAPAATGALPTHKEDTSSASSAPSIADWRESVIRWYAGGPRPGPTVMMLALEAGLPADLPVTEEARIRALAFAGFTMGEIERAVPEVNRVRLVDLVSRIPKEAFKIVRYHREGYTPLAIARQTGIPRSKVYYWLNEAGLKPHRSNRQELTARQKDQIRRAFDRGEPMASIARRMKVSYEQVRYALKGA